MAFSMHSHSGQFCPGHAKDQLEDVIKTAIARGMRSFALTEHMPRMEDQDRYPEEIEANHTIAELYPRHDAYILEAQRLQFKYASQISILIGFEGEWIRPAYAPLITSMAAHPAVDFFIGSVHHVHEIPIDYDTQFYARAREAAGGTDERLFEDYFDSQLEMLESLRPVVVGHFDLIRLMCEEPDRDLKGWGKEGVWERVVRNLRVVVEQGGLLEVNSAGLRKGLKEPYPGRSICEEFLKMGGKFTLSDDSHGIDHVGTNYKKAFDYLDSLGVKEVYLPRRDATGVSGQDGRAPLTIEAVTLEEVKQSFQ
ncbi:histidinol-phosphatase-like protein [Xylogone sp. PMI_703]|nr:histidinol-phosphatase-like protein [Xylogone sp. PMI_703]